jgi:hypothetical protein
MAKGFNYYKLGAVLSLITLVYVLVVLSANSVEATSRNKAYKNLQASSDATRQDCSHISCKLSGDEIDPRYGVQKRIVPTGPNPLHN